MASQLSFVTLDVFTKTRYTGNPLAIVKVPQSVTLSQTQKQRIAREFNLSETVFLHEQTEKDKSDALARIDIFTAYAEVPFAGHPTVGTANYLYRLDKDSTKSVRTLQAKAGLLGITPKPEVDGMQISVAHNVRIHNNPFPNTNYSQHPVVSIVKGMTFILAQQASLEELGKHQYNLVGTLDTYKAKDSLDEGWREGIVVSYLFVDLGLEVNDAEQSVRNLRTRSLGSREDPATGSAASALTSYLTLNQGKPGKYRYHITQGVEMGQRSEIFVEVAARKKASGDGLEIEEVLLSGSAVLTMQGALEVPEA